MNTQTKPLAGTLALLGALGAIPAAHAQFSPWYITDDNHGMGFTHVMKAGSQILQYPWADPGEIPIYVDTTVRQANYAGNGSLGEEYTIAEPPTAIFNAFNNSGRTAFDAGFDGTNVYIVDWPTGQVATYDNNYTTGTRANLFKANQNDLGITVDGAGFVWTSNWGSGMISQWNPGTGALLTQFPGYGNNLSALAYDCKDNTLWVADGLIGRQFDLSGNLINQIQLPDFVLGGEIGCHVPAPGPTALLGLSGLVAATRRRPAGARA